MKGKLNTILLGSSTALIAAQGAWAANQTYDPANVNDVWDTTTENWMDPTVWVSNNIADFGGTGESVAVAGAIEVGGMTFHANGYVIASGAGSLDLGTVGANMFTVASEVSAEISAALNGGAGEFIAKTEAGSLTLSGGVAHTAEKLTMTAGVLDVSGSSTALKLSGATIIDGAGGTINGTGGGKILLDNATGNTIAPAGVLTVNAILADGAGNKVTFASGSASGSSTVLTGANTWTGATTLFAASGRVTNLSVSSIGSWGSGIPGNLGAPATSTNGTIGVTLGNATASVVLQYTGTGETTNRDVSLASSSGTFILDQSGTGLLKFTGNISSLGGNRTLKLRGSGAGEISGNVTKVTSNVSLMKEGAGTWTLSGANLFGAGGSLSLQGGVLELASATALGTLGTAIPNTIILGGGTTLRYIGPAATVINRTFTLGNANGDSATLDASGTGPGTMSFTSASALAFGSTNNHTLNLTGSNTGANTLAAAIGDNTGLTSVNKTGVGTWVLTNANTYTGGTTVENGTLLLNNTGGSGAGTGALTVKTGATLGGSGSADGGVTIDAGATVAPGNSTGTLTLGSANLAGTYQCQLDASTGDRLTVTGDLVISPGATITISELATPTAASYTILSYGSLSGGSLPAITPPSGYELNTATPGVVRLVKIGFGYSAWAAINAPSGTTSDDYDGDGVSNGVEWILGGLGSTNDLAKLPTVTTNGGNFVFTFVRHDDAWLSGDTTVDIEVGTTLGTWPGVYHVGIDTASSTTPGIAIAGSTVTLTVPMAPDAAKFARLKVTVAQ